MGPRCNVFLVLTTFPIRTFHYQYFSYYSHYPYFSYFSYFSGFASFEFPQTSLETNEFRVLSFGDRVSSFVRKSTHQGAKISNSFNA